MRQAVILVGGRGTRLGALARDVPKPLLPIAGETRFLDYLLLNIARHGFGEVLLLAGHLAEVAVRQYEGARVLDATVRVIAEPAPAGTAGALLHAADALDDIFLMANGDTFFDVNYLALAMRLNDPNAMAAMALRRVSDTSRFGQVESDGVRISAFHEKGVSFKGESLISAGVYVLRRGVLDLIAQTPCSIETDVFPKLAAQGALLGFESDGYFIDIGLPETLAEARAGFADRMRRAAFFFDRDGTLIVDHGYTHKPSDLRWQPGAVEAIRAVNDSGALAIVVTNQGGVARGYYSEADMRRFHAHMQAELARHGAHIDAFYHCPFHGEGVIPEFAHAHHPDRKPNPGMLRRALTEWPIERERCTVIGDSDADIGAAAALYLPRFKVQPGRLLDTVRRELKETPPARAATAPATARLKHCAAAARAWLFEAALPLWAERGFDRSADCFHERIALDGRPVADLPRRIRVQARQTAVFARAGRLGWTGPWREIADTGTRILRIRAIRPDGGARHLLGPDGAPSDERRDLYDLAFVVYALAEAAQALGDRRDLIDAAEALVAWAEAHWSDPLGGFGEGEVTPTPPRRQNPHMHLFEALLALHEANGKPEHLARAGAIAALFRDKLFDARHGALPEYFDAAWRAQDERITEPGHHFEWCWLLDRWRRLGGGDLSAEAERLRVHGEVYGVELGSGAIYDEVFADGRARTKTSRLWPHTERIKANVARFACTRDVAAADAAVEAFDMLMRYCDTPVPGLWRDRRLPDGSFVEEAAPASSFYHIMLALSELIRVADELELGG